MNGSIGSAQRDHAPDRRVDERPNAPFRLPESLEFVRQALDVLAEGVEGEDAEREICGQRIGLFGEVVGGRVAVALSSGRILAGRLDSEPRPGRARRIGAAAALAEAT